MKIDLKKLSKAGFHVSHNTTTGVVEIYPGNTVASDTLVELLRSYSRDPMLQDLIVSTTLQTIERAQIMEHFE